MYGSIQFQISVDLLKCVSVLPDQLLPIIFHLHELSDDRCLRLLPSQVFDLQLQLKNSEGLTAALSEMQQTGMASVDIYLKLLTVSEQVEDSHNIQKLVLSLALRLITEQIPDTDLALLAQVRTFCASCLLDNLSGSNWSSSWCFPYKRQLIKQIMLCKTHVLSSYDTPAATCLKKHCIPC